MIIDSHVHACGNFLNGKGIIEILDKNNVDKVVLVPGELGSDRNYSMPEFSARFPNTDIVFFVNPLIKLFIGLSGAVKKIKEGNKYVYSLAKAHPNRIIQFYWARLSLPDAMEDLERHYAEYGFKGIKLHQCWEYFKVGSDCFHRVAQWAALKGLPIFVHLFSKSQATQLAKYIKEHSKTKFIIGHLFGLERYIEICINSDNVFFEISTPQLVSIQRLKRAIQYFGAKRILLGSDTPFGQNNLELNIKRIMDLNISDEEKNRILGDNMKELLRI